MRRILITISIIISSAQLLHAQFVESDTLFYNNEGNSVQRTHANYYKIFLHYNGSNRVTKKTFYSNHSIRSITHFSNKKLLNKVDTAKAFYEGGHLHWLISYNEKGETTYLKQLYENGRTKRVEFYKNGKLIKRKKYNKKGLRIRFTRFNQAPTYKGGYQRMIYYLNRTIQYPEQARALNISGTVIISFIVTKDGKVEQPKIERSVHPMLDEEALRVVRLMEQWVAGKMNDKKVNTRMSIPITFGKPMAEDHIPVGD